MTTTISEFFEASNPPPAPPDPLRDDLIHMVQQRHEATPRHQQVELGPSEIANPCMRRMAFGLMQVPRCNPEYDPLPSIIGTASHTWMQDAAELANEKLGRERWLTETRVNVTSGLSGTSDLFDLDTGTVIDHKFLGTVSFTKYLKDPGYTYRGQVNLYGRGFRNAGYEVKRVAIAFFPRAGMLRKLHLWQEPYNDALVNEILTRREQVIGLIDDIRVEIDPDRFGWIPATPESCTFCPYWSPRPSTGFQCEGTGK